MPVGDTSEHRRPGGFERGRDEVGRADRGRAPAEVRETEGGKDGERPEAEGGQGGRARRRSGCVRLRRSASNSIRSGCGRAGAGAGVAAATPARTSASPATAPNAGPVPVKDATAPSTGPKSAPAIAAPNADPISWPRRPAGAAATSQLRAPVHENALETPCRKRARSSAQTESASPKATVVNASSESPISTVGLTPRRAAAIPPGNARDQRACGIHRLQYAGAGLAEVEARRRNAGAAVSAPRRTSCRRGRSPRSAATACAQAEANRRSVFQEGARRTGSIGASSTLLLVDLQQVARGLWRWVLPHPEWEPPEQEDSPADWPAEVGCVAYETPRHARADRPARRRRRACCTRRARGGTRSALRSSSPSNGTSEAARS